MLRNKGKDKILKSRFKKVLSKCNLRTKQEVNSLMELAIRQTKIDIIDEIIGRLKTVKKKDCLFPLAGQEYRDNIIKMLKLVKKEKGGRHSSQH